MAIDAVWEDNPAAYRTQESWRQGLRARRRPPRPHAMRIAGQSRAMAIPPGPVRLRRSLLPSDVSQPIRPYFFVIRV